MKRRYFCPHCSGLLNPGALVVFIIERECQRMLILLSPEPGNYAVEHGELLKLVPGLVYTFRCPVCHEDLASPADDRFVEIQSLSEDGEVARVNFSRVYGQQATFFVSDAGVERYGEHAFDYEPVNFFGEGMRTRDS